MTSKWPLYVAGVLLLAVLAAWGSRERSWSKQVEQLTTEKRTMSDTLAVQKAETESLRKESETTETMEPVMLAGGVVAYVTHKSSRTIETAMKQATEQVAQYKQQVVDLQLKLTSKETEIVKSAPFWNVVVGWEPMASVYYAGGGVNLGPISVSVDNPVAMELRPRLSGMIRF